MARQKNNPKTTSRALDLDAALLRQIEAFYTLYRETTRLRSAFHRLRAKAERDPRCPPHASPANDAKQHARRSEFLRSKGCEAAYDAWNAASRKMGLAARAIMATPAKTLPGVLAKIRIAAMVADSSPGAYGGDEDLASFQQAKRPRLAGAIRDLERVAKVEARP